MSLRLDNALHLDAKTIGAANLCDRFTERDLSAIGLYVLEGVQRDELSRAPWLRRNQAALDLAMQLQVDKSFPWPGASNVKFPLVTIAAIQWHARAYPALVPGKDIVKCMVQGEDPSGEKTARSARISTHMSYQVNVEDHSWEEQQDRLLVALPIVGSLFKKSYFHPGFGRNTSEVVSAADLIFNYWSKSVEECPRKTHRIFLFRNELHERVVRGTFSDCRKCDWFNCAPAQSPDTNIALRRSDLRAGESPPQPDESTPFECFEQHLDLDLDDDGYAEPYIITVERGSGFVLRIVARFEEQDVERINGYVARVRATEYFTKYPFIPSPDGGVLDIGFGVLLGPLNESVNSLINQLIDCGTMQTTAGGFLGRGVKVRGGAFTFAPLEWKRVESTGDDLRKNIFPLPVRDPSAVLFNLLSLLVNYTNRISGSTDAMVGENPGQNTPAETQRSMVEQGQKIYNAIFKRVWRAMGKEFQKLFILNARFMPEEFTFGEGAINQIKRSDYLGDPASVIPVADPNLTSDSMRMQVLSAVKQSAAITPGYDKDKVEVRWLKALKIEGVEEIFPGSQKLPPPPNPKVVIEQMRQQAAQGKIKADMMKELLKIAADRDEMQARIDLMKAQAAAELSNANVAEAGAKIAAFEAQIKGLQAHHDVLQGYLELAVKESERAISQQGGVPGMAGPSGNSGSAPPAPAQAAGGDGGMGGGSFYGIGA